MASTYGNEISEVQRRYGTTMLSLERYGQADASVIIVGRVVPNVGARLLNATPGISKCTNFSIGLRSYHK